MVWSGGVATDIRVGIKRPFVPVLILPCFVLALFYKLLYTILIERNEVITQEKHDGAQKLV